MGRGIDHLVLPVRDIRKARGFYQQLGFTVTPVNWHPFGTMNSLVQFDGCFLELLAVADESAIPDADDDVFSFAGFNRDFLKRREGFSMLVLESASAEEDRKAFDAAGLRTYQPFRFVRDGRMPDGSTRTVAFSLTFASTPQITEAGFFTCQQHFPENFWNRDYQSHDNGVGAIAGVIMAAPEPETLKTFFEGFSGEAAKPEPAGGIWIETARGFIQVLSPEAVATVCGKAVLPPDLAEPRFVAAAFAVPDLAAMGERLTAAGIPHDQVGSTLVVPRTAAFGTALLFTGS